MSDLGPGPASDVNPGVPQRDLRDAIRVAEGYDPISDPKQSPRKPRTSPQDATFAVLIAAGLLILLFVNLGLFLVALALFCLFGAIAKALFR